MEQGGGERAKKMRIMLVLARIQLVVTSSFRSLARMLVFIKAHSLRSLTLGRFFDLHVVAGVVVVGGVVGVVVGGVVVVAVFPFVALLRRICAERIEAHF